MAEIVDDRIIINRALARIGSSPIFALDEETPLARQAAAVYYDRRDALLGLHPWRFARKTSKLTQVPKAAEQGWSEDGQWGNGYAHAYHLPGEALGAPVKILPNPRMPHHPLRDFLLEEGRLYADREPLWGAFTVPVSPQLWPPAFRMAMIVLVAGDLAVPVSHDSKLAETLITYGEGPPDAGGTGGLVGKALAADVSGSPGPSPLQQSDDLTTAHMS